MIGGNGGSGLASGHETVNNRLKAASEMVLLRIGDRSLPELNGLLLFHELNIRIETIVSI